MDHGRSLGPIHHHQLKKSSSAISAEKQIPIWVFGDLLDDHCVAHNVLDVFRFDVVRRSAERRTSTASIVLRNLGRTLAWPHAAPVLGVLGADIWWR